jgi:hypothetical protein
VNELIQHTVQCPYCWELIEVLIDGSVDEQVYIEDCQVCCRPINFSVNIEVDESVSIKALHEDDV